MGRRMSCLFKGKNTRSVDIIIRCNAMQRKICEVIKDREQEKGNTFAGWARDKIFNYDDSKIKPLRFGYKPEKRNNEEKRDKYIPSFKITERELVSIQDRSMKKSMPHHVFIRHILLSDYDDEKTG